LQTKIDQQGGTMLKAIFILTVTTIIAIGSFGCAQFNISDSETLLEKNWGRSYESARYHQILNPEAEKHLKPVEGLSGPAAEKIIAGEMASSCASTGKQ
jgi:hypothetical protein